jgi:uncharacterized protein (TIGR03435 family)
MRPGGISTSGLGLALAGALCILSASGQPAGDKLAFEVASIKPSKPGGILSGGLYPGGRFAVSNITLRLLIEQAYRIRPYQHRGGPTWLDSDTFDVNAEAGRTISNDEFRAMLQSLLAERFRLVMHEDSRRLSGYALAAGKSGPQLQRAKAEPGGRFGVRTFGGRMSGPASMQQLADAIGAALETPVVDRTGLEGYFDFSFPWTPGVRTPQPQNAIDAPPSLFTALEDLGLKLQPEKNLAPLFVIDRAELPSEN